MSALAATVSYRTPNGTWTHLPADRDAENLRLARRWDKAVKAIGLLDQADRAAADKPTYTRRQIADSHHRFFDAVIAALNLTDAEYAQALAEARRLEAGR